jgi:F-type H+-transporting ATPase subunit gamma
MIYEPSKEFVVNRLHQQIVSSLFLESFLELKASEYSSRMMAMQSATDAADKITSELSLQFNKARQQAITQEIAELVGASAAITS